MNPRYRCAWCGSFSTNRAPEAREHIIRCHKRALTALLRPLEAFSETLEPWNVPEDPEDI